MSRFAGVDLPTGPLFLIRERFFSFRRYKGTNLRSEAQKKYNYLPLRHFCTEKFKTEVDAIYLLTILC